MNNENFAGIMGTVKQAEITNGVCGYDTENRYAVLRVCVPRKSGAEDTVIVAAKIKENENIDAAFTQKYARLTYRAAYPFRLQI